LEFDHVILIGQELKAEYNYQVKVGNIVYNKERKMSEDEWQELFTSIGKMVFHVFGGGGYMKHE